MISLTQIHGPVHAWQTWLNVWIKVGGECWNMISDIAITLVAKDDMLAKYWLVVWNICYFSIDWECHHPN